MYEFMAHILIVWIKYVVMKQKLHEFFIPDITYDRFRLVFINYTGIKPVVTFKY